MTHRHSRDRGPKRLRRIDPASPPREMLLVFARCPDVGACKTRLIPAFGAAGAADIHRRLLQQTFDVVGRACPPGLRRCQIQQTGTALKELQSLVAAHCPQAEVVAQPPGDLGFRLQVGISAAFSSGLHKVVAIGTDCPELEVALLDHAFRWLSQADVVLGPAADGGYYLIGLNAPHSELFRDVDWGTHRVFRQTIDRADELDLTVRLLPELRDVDRPEDVRVNELLDVELPA